MSQLTTITGTFKRHIWQSPDGPFRISVVVNGDPNNEITVKGNIDERDPLTAGSRYTFQGQYEREGYRGKKPAFAYKLYNESEPLNRSEVVAYMQRKLRDCGIGYGTASRIFDAFGEKAIETLRNDPAAVASHKFVSRYLTLDKAREASSILIANRALAETEIKLIGLLQGGGFPHSIIKEAIKIWGVRAAKRVQHDPFSLLVRGLPGCGFARCDKLYSSLGCNPHRLKRQAICLWNIVRDATDDSTWVRLATTKELFDKQIGGTKPRFVRAVKLAIHPQTGILSLKKQAGEWWIAETVKARAERTVADRVAALLAWSPPVEVNTELIDDVGMQRFEINRDWLLRRLVELGDEQRDEEILRMIDEGQATGVCQFCGRELTNAESMRRGYGPVCAERWGLPWGDEQESEAEDATTHAMA